MFAKVDDRLLTSHYLQTFLNQGSFFGRNGKSWLSVIAELIEHSSSEGGFESSCRWIMGESKIEKKSCLLDFLMRQLV
jgi:hypothetical protein